MQESLQSLVNDALRRSQTSVTVRVDADKAIELIEEAEEKGDGIYFLDKVSSDWLTRTALSYADSAEVLEPGEIREDIAKLAKKALDENLVDLDGSPTTWRRDEEAEDSAPKNSNLGPRIHRLVRMTNILPYFKRHPDKSMMEAWLSVKK